MAACKMTLTPSIRSANRSASRTGLQVGAFNVSASIHFSCILLVASTCKAPGFRTGCIGGKQYAPDSLLSLEQECVSERNIHCLSLMFVFFTDGKNSSGSQVLITCDGYALGTHK
eukprot:155951-Pelagomonas_calceolata.AAC.1